MESLKSISSLEIPTNKIFYDKKTEVFSAEILDFMFVGTYKKSTRISKILDDIFASLKEVEIQRNDLRIIDFVTNTEIPETTKLKSLKLMTKKKVRRKEKKPEKKKQIIDMGKKEIFEAEKEESLDEDKAELISVADDLKYEEERYEEEKLLKRDDRERDESRKMEEAPKTKKKSRSLIEEAPPPAGGASPVKTPAPSTPSLPSDALKEPILPPEPEIAPSIVAPEEPKPKIYEINMGLQYYSVMMQQRSYLFYVYFSHKELKIVDEEGKTVYKTTVIIVTTKEEPPVLDLKIEGKGFEVHPIFGKVEVKKDAVNPPVMIFSIMPTKSSKKLKKKESERRFLNVYIEFEEKVISHTILSIIVQPKYFRLELGPIHLNLSKKTAAIISFISVLIAGISLVYTLFSWDPSSSFINFVSGFAPGLGSIIFIIIFLITLFKEGIYPLKEKITAFLNFDQAGVLIK